MDMDTTGTGRRMAEYRARMCAKGMRPVQIWVPDTRAAHFRKEAARQSLLLVADKQEKAVAAWLEKVADTKGWR